MYVHSHTKNYFSTLNWFERKRRPRILSFIKSYTQQSSTIMTWLDRLGRLVASHLNRRGIFVAHPQTDPELSIPVCATQRQLADS